MPRQIRKTKRVPAQQEETAAAPTQADSAEHDRKVDEIDALLDEIDDVLEENAEEFVKAYVQKGGEAVAVVLDWLRRALVFPSERLRFRW